MDVQEPLEQFESDPQEPADEESQVPTVDSTRQEETAQETEAVQSVEAEAEVDLSVLNPNLKSYQLLDWK